MPEGGFSTEGQTPNPEQEVKYERRTLAESSDMITFNGKDILNSKDRIAILMGSDNPKDAAKSKRLRLHYTDEEFDANGEKSPHWLLIDDDVPLRSKVIKNSKPVPLGRDNRDFFPPEEGETRRVVSRKHAALIASGDTITVIQRSQTNKTFIDAPQTTIVSTDLMSQSGTAK